MNERLITDGDREVLKKEFETISNDVDIKLVPSPDKNDEYSAFTLGFLSELAELNPRIKLEVNAHDSELAGKENISSYPYILLGYDKGFHIEFMGSPAGYEARTLIDDIIMLGTGESGLSTSAKGKIKEVLRKSTMHVFVTPQCPYCPGAVKLAHAFAFENKLIRGICVEATENAEISDRFNVSSVPQTVLNESQKHIYIGAQPEMKMVSELLSYL